MKILKSWNLGQLHSQIDDWNDKYRLIVSFQGYFIIEEFFHKSNVTIEYVISLTPELVENKLRSWLNTFEPVKGFN